MKVVKGDRLRNLVYRDFVVEVVRPVGDDEAIVQTVHADGTLSLTSMQVLLSKWEVAGEGDPSGPEGEAIGAFAESANKALASAREGNWESAREHGDEASALFDEAQDLE